jgi:hypothetical protein
MTHKLYVNTYQESVTFQLSHRTGSSASMVSYYRLHDRVRSPKEAKHFSSSLCVQTSSEDHPASYPIGTGGKARPGRNADDSPSSRAEDKIA